MVEQTIFLRIAKNYTDNGSKSRKFGQKEVIINTYNDIHQRLAARHYHNNTPQEHNKPQSTTTTAHAETD